jgi:hypothetical protein
MKDQTVLTPAGTTYIRIAVKRPDGTVNHYVSTLGQNLDADWQIGMEATHSEVGSGIATVEGYNQTTGEIVHCNEAILKIQTKVEAWRLKRDNGVCLTSSNTWFAYVVAWNETEATSL